MILRGTATQFLRFALVGLASNLVLYLLYLALTGLGIGIKLAMTLLYVVGVLQSFVFNRRWSFGHLGRRGPAFVRYVAAYGIGYVVNLLGLMLFVDWFGQPHQVVQGLLILTVAVLLFALHKFWVFAPVSPQISR